jgi:hypothetical protein
MVNYDKYVFYNFYKKSIVSKGISTFLYGNGYANGLSGLFPLDIPSGVYPSSGMHYPNLTGSHITLTWTIVPFADTYTVQVAETTTSGAYSGDYELVADTENSYYTYTLIQSGLNTRYVWWKITPIHQELEGSVPLIMTFSYSGNY